jgi:hypothetical protein
MIDGYLNEVLDAGFVSELIGERFDNALELMTQNAVVYGGAVRDALADLPLVGDLDIAAAPRDVHTMQNSFLKNPKWISSQPLPSERRIGKSPTGVHLAPMDGVTEFVTINGATVQLMASAGQGKSHLERALYVARSVDFVCCAVVLLSDGRVFEALPGAYDDCRERILRVNESSDTIYLESMPSRVEKLTSRGWKSDIDVPSTVAKIKRERVRQQKRAEKRNKAMMAAAPLSNRMVFDYRSAVTRGTSIEGASPLTYVLKTAKLEEVNVVLNDYARDRNTVIVSEFRPGPDKLIVLTPREHRSNVNGVVSHIKSNRPRFKHSGKSL